MGGRNRVKDQRIGKTGVLLTNNPSAYQAHAVCRPLDGQCTSKPPQTAHGVCLLLYSLPSNDLSVVAKSPNYAVCVGSGAQIRRSQDTKNFFWPNIC